MDCPSIAACLVQVSSASGEWNFCAANGSHWNRHVLGGFFVECGLIIPNLKEQIFSHILHRVKQMSVYILRVENRWSFLLFEVSRLLQAPSGILTCLGGVPKVGNVR